MTSYVGGCAPVSKAELLDFYSAWIGLTLDAFSDQDMDDFFAPSVDHAIGELAEHGLVVEDRDSVTLTPAGDVFVTAWLRHMEQRDG